MDRKWMEKEARRTLKNHEYELIASGRDCEVWRCKKPNTTMYGFDICVSLFGIAVHGDIGSLSFRVGIDYGMEFLAGRDINYYIHSKLEHLYYNQREVSKKLVKNMIAREFFYQLEDLVCDPSELESDWDEDDIGFKIKISENSECLQNMVNFAERVEAKKVDGIDEGHAKRIYELLEAYNMLHDLGFETSEEHVSRIMYENTSIDQSDGLSITEADESIMMRLYYVNRAAKNIMRIKEGTHSQYRHMYE